MRGNVYEHVPIMRPLSHSWWMLPLRKEKGTLEIVYTIVKENLPFAKMKSLSELKEMCGVELGDQARAMFVEVIAPKQVEFQSSIG